MIDYDKLKLLELYSNINYTVLDENFIMNYINNSDDNFLNEQLNKLLISHRKDLRDCKNTLNNYIKGNLIIDIQPKDKNNIDFLFNKLKRLSELKGSEIMNYIGCNKLPIYFVLTEKEKELIQESYTLTLNSILLELFELLGGE